MRIIFKIYRTAKVGTADLKGAAGLALDADNDVANQALRKKYGPHMAPGFRIFWPEPAGFKSTAVGIEAMSFNLGTLGSSPHATEGLVTCDPIKEHTTHRIDGALRSELMRLGVWTEADDYEWRGWYEIKP